MTTLLLIRRLVKPACCLWWRSYNDKTWNCSIRISWPILSSSNKYRQFADSAPLVFNISIKTYSTDSISSFRRRIHVCGVAGQERSILALESVRTAKIGCEFLSFDLFRDVNEQSRYLCDSSKARARWNSQAAERWCWERSVLYYSLSHPTQPPGVLHLTWPLCSLASCTKLR